VVGFPGITAPSYLGETDPTIPGRRIIRIDLNHGDVARVLRQFEIDAVPRREPTAGEGNMVDTAHVRQVIEKALTNAREAKLGIIEQMQHAARSVMQMHPELSQEDAVTAVRRIMRPN
jgi:hypothetical protein